MNKKGIIGLVIAIIIIIIVSIVYVICKNTSNNSNIDNNLNTEENQEKAILENVTNNNTENKENSNDISSKENKILVVYYSAQNHTKAVAEKIANNLNADIFEIEPEEIYSVEDLNWSNNNSRVSKEHNDESLRNVKLKNTKVANWEDYDTVLIGYPIWWEIAAWPVDTFVKANDFKEKTVIPFCTSVSSELGQSGELLKEKANSGNWLQGHRFSSSPSDSDIKAWTNNLKNKE